MFIITCMNFGGGFLNLDSKSYQTQMHFLVSVFHPILYV